MNCHALPAVSDSPALAFALKCLLTNNEPEDLIRCLPSRNEWPAFLSCARYHRLVPAIWHRLAPLAHRLPAEAVHELEISARSNAVHNMLLLEELQNVSKLLIAQDIPHLCFKGPVMSFFLYGDAARRQSADIDLLIRSEQLLKARRLLIDNEYRPYLEMKDAELRLFIKGGWGCGLIQKSRNIFLDLDCGITPYYYGIPLKAEDLWQQRQTITMDGAAFQIPSTRDLLLLLTIHGAKHSWKHLAWLLDLSTLSSRISPEDWEETEKTARKLGALNMLLLAAYLAGTTLNAKLPETIFKTAEQNKPCR
jgi:hypothetical protein